MTQKKRISIVGCGAIGTEIALAIEKLFSSQAELTAVCEIDGKKKQAFDTVLKRRVPALNLMECIEASDLVIEAAHRDVVCDLLKQSAMLKRDVMILSVAGLLDDPNLLGMAREKGIKVYIPTGAIGGLDLLKAACMGQIYSVELTTKKPIEALKGAPFFRENRIDLDSLLGEKMIYEGKASEAVKLFPQNVNVAATLSLVGVGADKTWVRIITSRTFKTNVHEISIEGEFGRAHMVFENEPSPRNPKTSRLASFSALATLKKILNGSEIGT